MTITEAREKCKSVVATIPRDVLILAILILASSLSFGLGYVAGLDVGRDTNTPFEASPIVATSIEGRSSLQNLGRNITYQSAWEPSASRTPIKYGSLPLLPRARPVIRRRRIVKVSNLLQFKDMNDDFAQGASIHDTAEQLAHAIHEGRQTMPEDRPPLVCKPKK